ncbi:MAG: transporter substrate-binding domain-containing protein [Simkaniaceae bacterium]|nr:transporter substrate-binding domain-containing protein [Simkaniaceae bacterium]
MKKRRIFLSILFVFFGFIFANGSEQKPFIVGMTSGYAPFVSLNEKGEYEGFDIDFAQALAEKLNRPLVLKDCGSMSSLMLSLQQKKIDAIIWGISITKERSKNFDLVYYQGEKVLEMPFIFWKEIPDGIQIIDDLARNQKKPICLEAGSYQDGVISKYPAIQTKYFDKVTDAILEVRYGKSLAACIDPSLVSRFTKEFSEIRVCFLPLEAGDQALGNGVCLSKSNPELTYSITLAVKELQREGKIAEIEEKWGLK